MVIDENKPLVSIVTPVYNAEQFVSRMLSSILSQSYPNIEMICVDDGSDDNTAQIIHSFKDTFEEKNMRLVYAQQPHSGQTAAVNTGLKLVNGEYLSWVDSDDFLTEKSIETKLHALMSNMDYNVATSDCYVVDESNLNRILYKQGDYYGSLNYQANQFYLALTGMSIIIQNCHLVRMKCFDRVFPQRELIACIEGQNYQLMLPLYHHYRRFYVDNPLAYYVIRKESHYHRKRSEEERVARHNALTEMLKSVLDTLGFLDWEVKKLIKLSCFNVDNAL